MSETLFGICTEVSEKSGWTTFHIDVAGKQYPVKLATKKAEVIDAARAVGSSPSTWTYNEVESEKINEHTGKPFVNRYLEGVELGGSGSPPPASSSGGESQPRTGLIGADKDRAITRMACLKAAAETFKAFPGIPLGDETAQPLDAGLEVMKLAQRFEQWTYRDLEPPPFE